jgi:hypothetical protein
MFDALYRMDADEKSEPFVRRRITLGLRQRRSWRSPPGLRGSRHLPVIVGLAAL